MNIEKIMSLFFTDSKWGISPVRSPDPVLLESFKKAYSLPEDYVKMLSVTDGFVLFHAGDYRINDISWTMECKNNPICNPGFEDSILEVGSFLEQTLLINQREGHTSSYLYVGDSCLMTDYVRIGTITDFFNGLIESKGEFPFWEFRGQELFDFSMDNLEKNPGILEVPARGRTIVSTRPYYSTAEEIRVSGLNKAVIVEYSNGIEETIFCAMRKSKSRNFHGKNRLAKQGGLFLFTLPQATFGPLKTGGRFLIF